MFQKPRQNPAIVVVEDDPVLSVVLQRLIRKLTQHYEVIHVSDGMAALKQFELGPVPLVITDYHLIASIDGLKLTDRIRERWPETRIVLITAYATPDVEAAAYAHNVEFYLPKPFLLGDLEQIVRSLLNELQSQERGS
jgi:CheY-like chemotaxis protein